MAQRESSLNRNILAWIALACLALVMAWLFSAQLPELSLSLASRPPPVDQEGKAKTASLRKLKQAGEWNGLAEALDESMITIPAGEFIRGSNSGRWDEKPEQVVFLDAFEIDRYEVTNLQYRRFLQASGASAPRYWDGDNFPGGQADYPVVGITWEEADAYCQWAGKRLPTEAEWEKACRGADGRLYPWGEGWGMNFGNVDRLAASTGYANMTGPDPASWETAWAYLEAPAAAFRLRGLQPVGSYPEGASPYGVLDLVGNAAEWIADWYIFDDYSRLPLRNPITTSPRWNHALRGSSWYDPNGDPAWVQDQSRCAARNSSHVVRDARIGFRCAR